MYALGAIYAIDGFVLNDMDVLALAIGKEANTTQSIQYMEGSACVSSSYSLYVTSQIKNKCKKHKKCWS